MIPETEELIRTITMKLDENERATQIRLMKVKDMMLSKTHTTTESTKTKAALCPAPRAIAL